jgi:RNA polymerase sigma-70 factor, ECF subfamily
MQEGYERAHLKKDEPLNRHVVMSGPVSGAELSEIEAIYRRDLAKLQRVATAIVGTRDAGCDAVQGGFARAVYRRAEFRREGSLEGWLWRIVVTTARDAAARVWSGESSLGESQDVGGNTDEGDHAALRRAVARLPERQRLVVFLHYYADLEYGAIADALNLSTGTVGATLNQARATLRRMLVEVAR